MISESKRVVVTIPPRHGKSTFISQYFPAWLLARNPDSNVMLISYEQGVASYWGGKVRDTLTSEMGFSIKDDSSAKSWWSIDKHRGGMISVGIGGPITGKGADFLVVDDVIKNAQEAMSKTIRDQQWDWFITTALTRLNTKESPAVVVLTRWHEDDLPGRLMKLEGWECIGIPAIAEEDEYFSDGTLFRKAGEPLCPEIISLNELERLRETMGAYWFSALYQQRPSAIEGNLFKREQFHYFREDEKYFYIPHPIAKDECSTYLAVDLATTLTGDYTAIAYTAVTPENDILLLEMKRVRVEAYKAMDILLNYFKQSHPPTYCLVEGTGFQTSFVQMAIQAGLPAIPVYPDKNKVTRAMGLAAKMEAGKVFFLEGAPWLLELEDELLHFPAGAHDDQVDALTYAAVGPTAGAVELAPTIYK